ncbi:NAD dependent epimerase/dehydratase family protein-like protein [Zopfia rhizophila CBS 207.26]|uniref:NAD dependent epimerase/dehydratase family protein-like protein n=1 Tax=Zopfia rhizophila CBS 207.26 TaxID=1314779 RepID=A0A6A6DKV2_9PEZI|nr:NAD dependent epimerase/dehydratase family protein-like protein [Zopfia rhizophila CBS 207.26]
MSKILLTGATGYVGGTVLAQLIQSTESSLKNLTIDLLIRSDAQARKLKDAYGARVHPILWKGLDDTVFIADTAEQYDIIVNTGSGFIPSGAKAFVEGLARRVRADGPGGPAPWLLHISGCTNLSDRPLTQTPQPLREWDDVADNDEIFEFMRELDVREPYVQRTTEVGVLAAAAASGGVQAVSLNTPCIFGQGTGLFNQQGLVIPYVLRYIVRHWHGFKLNNTANFDWVHVEDLANLYILLVRAILERPDRGVGFIPSGKKGVMFPTVGRTLLTEVNQRALNAAFEAGVLPREGTPQDKEIRQATLKDIADELTAGREDIAERGWGGHKATKGTLGRKLLGWEPKYLEDAWRQDFVDELVALREGRRGITMESCIGVG